LALRPDEGGVGREGGLCCCYKVRLQVL
jgi:hypothetical protein